MAPFCCAERPGGVQLHDGERRGVSGVNVTNPARRCPPLPPGEKQAEGIAADFCEKFGRRARHGEKIGRSAAGMALHGKNAAPFRAEEVHKVLTESRDVGSFSYQPMKRLRPSRARVSAAALSRMARNTVSFPESEPTSPGREAMPSTAVHTAGASPGSVLMMTRFWQA